jgi:DNA-binding MarR family transcriptional regulator
MPSEGIRITALAEAALLTKPSIGYLIDDLEALGYVERAPDPVDRRAKVVRLTARGRAVEDTVRAVIKEVEVEWSARLGEDEYERLTRSLRRLVAIIEE